MIRGMPVESSRAVGPLLLAALAWAVQLVVGWFYLVGGLVIPGRSPGRAVVRCSSACVRRACSTALFTTTYSA